MNEIAIFLLFSIIISFLSQYLHYKRHKQRITNYLSLRGATNIVVSNRWNNYAKKYTRTYDVEYINHEGLYCRNSCKIKLSILSRGEIHWKYPTRLW